MDVSALAEVTLDDSKGNPQRLGDLWSTAPHVVLFLRHFG